MKYSVEIPEVHYISVEVEADSEEEAKDKALEVMENSDELQSDYSHMLEQDEWVVTDITEQTKKDEDTEEQERLEQDRYMRS